MQNSRIIWIEDTALNLLYSGKKSMKRFVMKEKFLPQDNIKDKIEPSIKELINSFNLASKYELESKSIKKKKINYDLKNTNI